MSKVERYKGLISPKKSDGDAFLLGQLPPAVAVARMPVAPPVGVIIPNHNCEHFIREAIQSVAAQSITNFQAVIVDDASTDGSVRTIKGILDEIADDRFALIQLERNVGQCGAIRQGLARLDAPFVAVLDSDDFWYESFLERHLAAHLNSRHPVALTFCNSHIVDGAGQLLAGGAWWFDQSAVADGETNLAANDVPRIDGSGRALYATGGGHRLYRRWQPNWSSNTMAAMMVRKAFLDLVLVSPDEQLRLYVDFYLSSFAALLTGVISIDEQLYAYRVHGANKHSDGIVAGGRYSSSSREWAPIQEAVLGQVLAVMESNGATLASVFGAGHVQDAARLVRKSLKRGSPRSGWGAMRALQSLFRA